MRMPRAFMSILDQYSAFSILWDKLGFEYYFLTPYFQGANTLFTQRPIYASKLMVN